ncbi:MAG: hypothetical protein IH600_18435 [Bacteroidetes bacterium]|nr:hypothetical protein [Bacteroidota bacterium]
MAECVHEWKMTNRQFGFVVYERCSCCQVVRAYYSPQDTWDDYMEEGHHWSIVENAQTFRFDLECVECGVYVDLSDLLGLMYCTSCMEDCEVEIQRKKYEAERTFVLVGFGYLPESMSKPISEGKLQILSEYFNQRRDTSRSRIKIIPNSLIPAISRCRGEFIHDVGMLSLEPPGERKPLF